MSIEETLLEARANNARLPIPAYDVAIASVWRRLARSGGFESRWKEISSTLRLPATTRP
jgi:hypothetical protein